MTKGYIESPRPFAIELHTLMSPNTNYSQNWKGSTLIAADARSMWYYLKEMPILEFCLCFWFLILA